MNNTIDTPQRNIEYVMSLVNERPGELDLFELTKQTRLKHSRENPLGLKDARNAIETAMQEGLIEVRAGSRMAIQTQANVLSCSERLRILTKLFKRYLF